ncbi:Gfo/Idh/MocA family protein [Thermodesulfobacteriota bacterium]
MKTINVGIIGTGRHGTRYANHIRHDVPGLILTAVSRRSKAGLQQAKEWQVRYHSNWHDLIKDPDVDAIIAVTPPNINSPIARSCAALGKPLLIEKPLAIDTETARQMLQLFDHAAIPLTVAQTLRFNTTILALQEELHRIGTLHAFSANQRLEEILHPWLDVPEIAGGGVILHSAVHLFDALRYITGKEILRVRASMFSRYTEQLEDLFTAQVEMENHIIGTVDAGKVGPARTGRFEFVGSDGQLQGDQVHGTMEFIHQNLITPLPPPKPISTLIPLLTAWHKHLIGNGPNPVPGEDGLEAVRICEACRHSAQIDDWVNLGKASDETL